MLKPFLQACALVAVLVLGLAAGCEEPRKCDIKTENYCQESK